ncbi:chloramphenicol phosphotransferase CPT family protein [Devosia psychrophila]|uniref:Chloramphenicol 3-O phosphotransferase n=1 Tax=Devosia psychrophila TaxID=728005 RepID=A0A0F5Q1Q7_9HYPH|nr:AAA family ATPase [Devosia psychrophila]KKC34838.1 chloramphenicol phosphotransferase [Devosia psychrophila]SFC10055.1 chloramphenicol 3-O phosphotransferase [Devosia psychrophila]
MAPGKIIFLHGASSSGKSTLARGVQARIGEPFWHISIDHLRDSGVLPMDRFKSKEFDWRAARAPFFDGFHRSLAAYAGAGNNLVLEHILDKDGWLEELGRLFAPFDVFFVGVHCPLPLLIEREKARGDRPVGSAEQDYRTIHLGKSYDFEVYGDGDAELNIGAILQAWGARSGASAFSRLAEI